MKKWENTIRRAQSAFQGKEYSAAISLNKEALAIASETFEEKVKDNTHKAVAAVMVSHFSLADAYIAIKSYDQAYLLYQKCFYFIQILNANSLPKTVDFETAIYHAINKLKQEWCAFKKYHSDDLQECHLIAPHEFQQGLSHLLKVNLAIH